MLLSNGRMGWRMWCAVAALCVLGSMGGAGESPVQRAARQVAERLAGQHSPEALLTLEAGAVAAAITPEERTVFAEQYWCFDVSAPAVVSIFRDVKQTPVPFWIGEAGFVQTALRVRNEVYEYEVWQKTFPAGRVGLGINGLDWHRPHYFVGVGAAGPDAPVTLGNFYPADQQVFALKEGAFTYHDWPELVLEDVPAALQGHRLLPTWRGRSREAHLVGAFRSTLFPPGPGPDQVTLTWRGDPKTTQSIQWRAGAGVATGTVRYREAGSEGGGWETVPAVGQLVEDALIVNAPEARLFTARLSGLKPGTRYVYTVGSEEARSPEGEFVTEPGVAAPFTFAFLSDTHNSPVAGELLANASAVYPKMAFSVISGDLVGIGQFRDDWDEFMAHTSPFHRRFPILPAIGNHDAIDGLGADLYLAHFDLPENGPAGFPEERAYSVRYGDAFFLVLDVTLSVAEQRPWIEAQLRANTAAWSFAVLHFPPYAPDDENPEIVREWIPVFDAYHVDFVFGGHVHHYMRSKPLRNSVPVDTPAEGTVYFLTVSTPGGPEPILKPSYAEVFDASGRPLYVGFTVEREQVLVEARDQEGVVWDRWVLRK